MNNDWIHPNSHPEMNYVEYIHRIYPSENNDLVKQITFQVTDDCCLRCSYCYQTNKGKHKLSFETAKKCIDEILRRDDKVVGFIDSYKVPGIVIEFIGGEPFLEIELIDKITDYFVEQLILLDHPWQDRYCISICSNGVLYFDPRVQEYIRKNQWNLSLSISVDGNKELHDSCRKFPDGSGSYEKAISAALHYKEHYRDVGTKMTISKENLQYLDAAVINMLELGYRKINLNCVFEYDWQYADASMLYQKLRTISDYILSNDLEEDTYLSILYRSTGDRQQENRNWCGSNRSMLAINWRGDYYPCIRFMEDSNSLPDLPVYTIGTVDEGIGKNAETSKRIEDLYSLTYESQSEDKCLKCPISAGCGWCTAYNYCATGSVNKRITKICCMHQAEVLASLYYYNNVFKKHGKSYRNNFTVPDDWCLNIISEKELRYLKELSKSC